MGTTPYTKCLGTPRAEFTKLRGEETAHYYPGNKSNICHKPTMAIGFMKETHVPLNLIFPSPTWNITDSCVCVCVCVWSPVKGGGFVKHAIPIAKFSPPWCLFHTLGLSSTTPWDPRGGRAQGGPNESLYLGLDSVATAWGLFHNLDSVPIRSSLQEFWEKRRRVSVLLPQLGTALTLRGRFSMKVGLLR